jgi:tetratricopeptide (TPR) repeat protein
MIPPPTAASPPPTRRKRQLFVVTGVVVFAAAAIAGYWYLRPPLSPLPPDVPMEEGADPAVKAAMDRAHQAVVAQPRSVDAWGHLGMVFGAHGYEAEATACFVEAERLAPTDPKWPYFQGVYTAVHDPRAALAPLRRAVGIGTTDHEAMSSMRLRLAETLLAAGDVDAADAIFGEELARSPTDARSRYGLAQIAMLRGDRSAAKSQLLEIESNPFVRQKAAVLLSALSRETGDSRAGRYAEAARRLPPDPSWPDPYIVQLRSHEVGLQGLLTEAESLESSGQLAESARLLMELAESHPIPRVLVAAGIVLAKLRDYSRAEAILRKCLVQEPDHVQANYFLSVVLFERAQMPDAQKQPEARRALLEAAVRHAQAAASRKSDHGLAWLYLGRARLELGQVHGAIEALEQSVACRPEIGDTQLYLAEALFANGDLEGAQRCARVAEELAGPGDSRARQLLKDIAGKGTQKKKS